MQHFVARLNELLAAVRRDPLDVAHFTSLSACIDAHPAEFKGSLPPELLTFRSTPAREDRRIQFLKQLLLHGYALPRIEHVYGSRGQEHTVNMAVVTSYFYDNAFSLLEAGVVRDDVAVFVVSPQRADEGPWITAKPRAGRQHVQLHAALMLDHDALIWRHFSEPVPVHYLFPVDNYYRDKFRLVTEYGPWGVPMPGSRLIREVCENKLLLAEIAGGIPGLHLAPEIHMAREVGERAWRVALQRFVTEHQLAELVSKPIDGFGGSGVEFWRYPEEREALLAWLYEAFTTTTTILIQGRIRSVPTRSGRDWNLRQYVLRSGPETVLSAWKRARVGHGVINTTRGAGSSTTSQLLADVALDGEQLEAFEAALQSTDELAVAVLGRLEEYLLRQWGPEAYHGAASNLAADLLALDFMIGHHPTRAGEFAVYLNEINDFASGGMRDYELLYHREALPNAPQVRATQPFALAPHVLNLASWRGAAYKAGLDRHI